MNARHKSSSNNISADTFLLMMPSIIVFGAIFSSFTEDFFSSDSGFVDEFSTSLDFVANLPSMALSKLAFLSWKLLCLLSYFHFLTVNKLEPFLYSVKMTLWSLYKSNKFLASCFLRANDSISSSRTLYWFASFLESSTKFWTYLMYVCNVYEL